MLGYRFRTGTTQSTSCFTRSCEDWMTCSCLSSIGASASVRKIDKGLNQALLKFMIGLPTTGDLCNFTLNRKLPTLLEPKPLRMNAASLVDMEPASTDCCKKLSSRIFKLAEESRKSARETLYEASSSNLKHSCLTQCLGTIASPRFLSQSTTLISRRCCHSHFRAALSMKSWEELLSSSRSSLPYAEMMGSSLCFQAVRRRQRLKSEGSSACLSKNIAICKDLSKAETLVKTWAAELAHLPATNLPPFDKYARTYVGISKSGEVKIWTGMQKRRSSCTRDTPTSGAFILELLVHLLL